jgi:hypothetical protein
MKNYYRITTYSPDENVSAIVDSYGKFDELIAFSAFLVSKNFKIRAISKEQNIEFGNIPKTQPDEQHLILRACQTGEPTIDGKRIEVNGKYYFKK